MKGGVNWRAWAGSTGISCRGDGWRRVEFLPDLDMLKQCSARSKSFLVLFFKKEQIFFF
jgi:hypothetical protein